MDKEIPEVPYRPEAIYRAMADINREVDAIGKDRRNKQQGFAFRGVDEAYNSLHRLFAKHGVVTIPMVSKQQSSIRQTKSGSNIYVTSLTVTYRFLHADGSYVDVGPVVGEGMDSADKSTSKALAIAHKYALFQTFTIPTLFTDPDAESHESTVTEVADTSIVQRIVDLADLMSDKQREFFESVRKDGHLTPQLANQMLTNLEQKYAVEHAKSAPPSEEMNDA